MISESYQALYTAIAGSAAGLTGLLFVAMSVAPRHVTPEHPIVIQQVRAAASLAAFTNALAVSLFGLVPGNRVGYPAIVVACGGIFFTAAGVRSMMSESRSLWRIRRQFGLVFLLLLTFGFELVSGIELVRNPGSVAAAETLGNLLVGLLIIGIARAWELIGDRDTGIIASIAVLTGRERSPAVPPVPPVPKGSPEAPE